MKIKSLILFFISAFALSVNAQQLPPQPKDGWQNTRKGNESFRKKDFATAEKYYKDGVEKDTAAATSSYNLGNALYRQKKYADAERAYAESTAGNNSDSLAKAWYNLGNAMLQQDKYQESINAYKQALKLKPNDEQTRYNLAYAQAKKKARQPPPKQNQKNQKNQKPQNKPQDQKDKEKAPSDPPPTPSMNKDEAQRMLEALKDQEKKTRDRMNSRKSKFSTSKEKDW